MGTSLDIWHTLFMKTIDQGLLDSLCQEAKASVRKRTNYNFHESDSDLIQRMCNALQLGTYVQPHRHSQPIRHEFFTILQGAAFILLFDERGLVTTRIELEADGKVKGCEVPAGIWHTVGALVPDTILFEIKPGPYNREQDKEFAPWAPSENSPDAGAAQKWLQNAVVGAQISLTAL